MSIRLFDSFGTLINCHVTLRTLEGSWEISNFHIFRLETFSIFSKIFGSMRSKRGTTIDLFFCFYGEILKTLKS